MVLPVFKRSQDLDAKLAYGIQFFWRKFEIFKTLECGRDLKIRSQNCDLRNPPNAEIKFGVVSAESHDKTRGFS